MPDQQQQQTQQQQQQRAWQWRRCSCAAAAAARTMVLCVAMASSLCVLWLWWTLDHGAADGSSLQGLSLEAQRHPRDRNAYAPFDLNASALMGVSDMPATPAVYQTRKWSVPVGGRQADTESLLQYARRAALPDMKVYPCDAFATWCKRVQPVAPIMARPWHFSAPLVNETVALLKQGGSYFPLIRELAKGGFTAASVRQAFFDSEGDAIDSEIPHVAVLENYAVTRTGDLNRLFLANAWMRTRQCESFYEPVTKTAHVQEIVVISQTWCGNYYHFLLECWLRLGLVLDLLFTHRNMYVHLIDAPTTRMLEILAILGIGRERIIDGNVVAQRVYVPEGVRCSTPPLQTLVVMRAYLSNALSLHVPAFATRRPKVLVVRRPLTSVRSIDNFSDLIGNITLSFAGADVTVFTGSESFLETLSLFAESDVIVAPHGAGLANVFVAKPSAHVIEFHGVAPVLCFFGIAARLGISYHLMAAQTTTDLHFIVPVGPTIELIRDILTYRQ